MLTQSGPGGRGSIPALVMRTGLIQPVNPANARRDITTQHVQNITTGVEMVTMPLVPPGSRPTVTPLIPAAPSPTTTAVAQTVVAVPPMPVQRAPDGPMPVTPSAQQDWHRQHHRVHPMVDEIRRLHPKAALFGTAEVELGEWQGRPIAKFEISAAPPRHGAQMAANSLRQAAFILARSGLNHMAPEIVGGPLAALLRGGAVELHFQNGVVARTAL
ncbi:MAG: hypothetical protein A2Y38_01400 [Spirochaetes bacterium GWB1_59_5]|nr:MAG: hypothetical protein A2Y38_01400 [Spirochaetes bacterium GWB1_59_5]